MTFTPIPTHGLPRAQSSRRAPSLPMSSDETDVSALLETITHSKSVIKAEQARLDAALDRLAELVEAGEADAQTTWNDYRISRVKRVKYVFPEGHPVTIQEAAYKQARDTAIAFGEAEKQVITYWDVRQV